MKRPAMFKLLRLAFAAAVSLPMAAMAAFPDHPIKVIVPVVAGSTGDVVTRLVAKGVSKELGQPVVVENRPGADTQIGLAAVARAAPDGYTLGYVSTYIGSVNKVLYPKLPYDVRKDFDYVANMAVGRTVLGVNASLGVNSLEDLVKYSKANPDKVNYASSSSTHIHYQAALTRATGIHAMQIPYKGNAPAVQSVATGETDYIMDQYSQMKPFIQAGKIKVIATLGDTRSPFLPDVPSMKDLGYDVNFASFFGLIAPAGTPKEVVERLNAAVNKVISSPAYHARMETLALSAQPMSVAEFREFALRYIDRLEDIARSAGLHVQ